MAQRRTLYYDGDQAIWRDPIQGMTHGTLADAAADLGQTEVVVIVPGEDVLITDVALPPIRQSRRRVAAARFALEDRLAGSIESQHFAPGIAAPGGDTPVAVVALTRMQAWCDDFEAAGLDVAQIVPDALALPIPDHDAWQLLLFDERVLVRTNRTAGFACARDLWPTLAGALTPPAAIDLHATSADAIHTLHAFAGIDPEPTLTPHTHASREALIGVLLDNVPIGRPPINLRQGAFARRSPFESRWRPFALTATLAAIWLVVAIAGRAVETWQLDGRIDALHQQTLAAFHTAFPEQKNVNDLRVQAEQGILALRGNGGSGLFPLLQAVAAVTGNTDALQVQAMQYSNGTLRLSINGKNVQSVSALRSGFAKQPGVQLSLQSTDADASGVQIQASLQAAGAS